MILTCKHFGAPFTAENYRFRYCDPCRKKIFLENERKAYKKFWAKEKPVCKHSNGLAECIKEADRLGLTYGKYMAMRGDTNGK